MSDDKGGFMATTQRRFSATNEKMDVAESTHIELALENMTYGTDMDSIEQTNTGRFIWLAAITASMGGLLFGYDTGIISATLVYLGTDLNHRLMTSPEKEAITSLCSGGAFFGAIIAGLTADKYGRKAGIYVG